MISILDYNNKRSDVLSEILDILNLDYIYTLNESEIINSDSIILPEIENFKRSYRKLQLTNISNLLKICSKPILAIGSGFSLMVNDIIDKQKKGLDFFDVNLKYKIFETEINTIDGHLEKVKSSKLISNIPAEQQIKVNLFQRDLISKYTTSVLTSDKLKFAITSENKNYFALHTDIKMNYEFTKTIILNFSKI